MSETKQKTVVPGITKVVVNLAFLYLVVDIVTVIVMGAATATPIEGPEKFKMYLSVGVIIALAAGLYKMEKWAWWCCVLTSGLRAAMESLAFFAIFMQFRKHHAELSGLGIFYISMVVLAFGFLAAIFVLLLSRRAREVYEIGQYGLLARYGASNKKGMWTQIKEEISSKQS
jgi:hypothetical protein